MNFILKLFKSKKRDETKLPSGWSETQVAENTFVTKIPQEEKNKWSADRRIKDKVSNLINKNGFHQINEGRAGTFYYVKDSKVCEFFYEMSAVQEFDILVWFEELNEWFLPEQHSITEKEKDNIKMEFIEWLKSKRLKSDL